MLVTGRYTLDVSCPDPLLIHTPEASRAPIPGMGQFLEI